MTPRVTERWPFSFCAVTVPNAELVNVVNGVVGLAAELRFEFLREAEALEQRKIEIVHPVATNVVEAGGQTLDIPAKLLADRAFEACVNVEPAVRGALAYWQRNVVQVAVKDGVAEALGAPALRFINALCLPATQEMIE